MKFKGFDLRTSFLITVGFFAVVTLMSVFTGPEISMVVASIGMIVAGYIGLRIDSYAFVKKNEMVTRSKRMNGIILYLNYLLIFLGLVMIFQQIF